jgi:transcriptional regulator with XRE-family HTH domain
MSADPLPENLGYLCGFYRSIAEVCRRLQINRQQFNKYLAGQTWPSRRNMRRICDFFGVTEAELLMEHSRFVEIVGLRRRPLADAALAGPLSHIERLYQHSGDLHRYIGYYFRYFYSFGYAGQIIKCLLRIYEKDGKIYWKAVERIRSIDAKYGAKISKYSGALFLLGDRIFALEYETLMSNSITQVILYPSYHNRVTYLLGVQTGAPLARGRKPAASIVLLEALGGGVDLRRALASCGLFEESDPAIDPTIRSLIANRIPPGTFVLEAEEV